MHRSFWLRLRALINVRHCGLVGSAPALERNRLWVQFLACNVGYISHDHWAYDYLGPFGVLWVHMARHKNCVNKKNDANTKEDWWAKTKMFTQSLRAPNFWHHWRSNSMLEIHGTWTKMSGKDLRENKFTRMHTSRLFFHVILLYFFQNICILFWITVMWECFVFMKMYLRRGLSAAGAAGAAGET